MHDTTHFFDPDAQAFGICSGCGFLLDHCTCKQSEAVAMHFSANKVGVDQIPAECLILLGEVFSYGEKKYARDNWKKGMPWHELYGSALRHLYAFWQGQHIDNESGLPHLAHAMWNIEALLYYTIHNLGEDDR